MAKKDNRFLVVQKETEGMANIKVLIDTQTGVNYLYRSEGYSGGLCVLLDRDGKPLISATGASAFDM